MSDIFTPRSRINPDHRNDVIDRTIAHFTDVRPDWLRGTWTGWDEPFCFSCGWLPPVTGGQPGNRAWHQAVDAGLLLGYSYPLDLRTMLDNNDNVDGIDDDHPWLFLCPCCAYENTAADGQPNRYLAARDHAVKDAQWQNYTDARRDVFRRIITAGHGSGETELLIMQMNYLKLNIRRLKRSVTQALDMLG